MISIGVDPGKAGGLSILISSWSDRTLSSVYVHPMPMAGDLVDSRLFCRLITDKLSDFRSDEAYAYVEKVSSMPGQGVRSMFSFGRSYGIVLGVLGAIGIPTNLVTPSAWKKVVLEGTDKSKKAAIEYCRRVYPDVNLVLDGCRVPHDGMADALAIADYGLRKMRE